MWDRGTYTCMCMIWGLHDQPVSRSTVYKQRQRITYISWLLGSLAGSVKWTIRPRISQIAKSYTNKTLADTAYLIKILWIFVQYHNECSLQGHNSTFYNKRVKMALMYARDKKILPISGHMQHIVYLGNNSQINPKSFHIRIAKKFS